MNQKFPCRRPRAVPWDKAPTGAGYCCRQRKGGIGKIDLAVHLIVALLRTGRRVASIDLDIRQGSLSRYLENRQSYAEERDLGLALPDHFRFGPELESDPGRVKAAEIAWFTELMGNYPTNTTPS